MLCFKIFKGWIFNFSGLPIGKSDGNCGLCSAGRGGDIFHLQKISSYKKVVDFILRVFTLSYG